MCSIYFTNTLITYNNDNFPLINRSFLAKWG